MGSTNSSEGTCGCKVGTMIDAYGIVGLNDRMVEWWTADDESRSLREIAEYFNRKLLREEMRRHGLNPLEGEVSNVYRLLTDDDVSRGMQTQARKRLERGGVDVDELTGNFVSHQSIYRHLNNCLDAEYEKEDRSPEAKREKAKRRIFSLESRTEAVTENTVTQLVRNDALVLADFDVQVDVSVTCLDCQRQYRIDEILENEGCYCSTE